MKFAQPIWTDDLKAIRKIHGANYKIELEIIYGDNGIPDRCKVLYWELTHEKETENSNKANYVKWGGYPIFRQGDQSVPMSDDGEPYMYLCTVDNNWGDMGNCNIFALLADTRSGFLPEDIYMEASCS